MGYFSNASEADHYHFNVCQKCVHWVEDERGIKTCPIMDMHFYSNYKECNNKDSFLHFLIPRKEGANRLCRLFFEDPKDTKTINMFEGKE